MLGLQFVVITFVTQTKAVGNVRDIHAFGTPTVTYFCSALLISAAMTAPWHSAATLGIAAGIAAIVGLAYSVRVVWHARAADYEPDWEDWTWYTILPFVGYLLLLAAAVLLWSARGSALVTIAGAAVLFLVLGIHNAWDTVTFVAVAHGQRKR